MSTKLDCLETVHLDEVVSEMAYLPACGIQAVAAIYGTIVKLGIHTTISYPHTNDSPSPLPKL